MTCFATHYVCMHTGPPFDELLFSGTSSLGCSFGFNIIIKDRCEHPSCLQFTVISIFSNLQLMNNLRRIEILARSRPWSNGTNEPNRAEEVKKLVLEFLKNFHDSLVWGWECVKRRLRKQFCSRSSFTRPSPPPALVLTEWDAMAPSIYFSQSLLYFLFSAAH